jgi:uncharacterized protein
MKILIDIKHPAQLNFFKNLCIILRNHGHTIDISYLRRGKLESIVKKEYHGYHLIPIGRHRCNKFSIIVEANIFRFFGFLKLLLFKRYDLCISVANFNLGFASKLLFIPNIQFTDDIERKFLFRLLKASSTKLILPVFGIKRDNIDIYNALKEWAYLSPGYFKPNEKILQQYKLKPKEYIFIREIDTRTFNYSGQSYALLVHLDQLPSSYTYIISLENKKNKDKYPANWILLNEPVEDIHSLIYFSKLLISTGDSMAREAAMLGVPAIYCGQREMLANDVLISKGILKLVPVTDLQDQIINSIIINNEDIREVLNNDWEDVNKYIFNEINKIVK